MMEFIEYFREIRKSIIERKREVEKDDADE